MMRALRAATSTASSLTVDSSSPVPPSKSESRGQRGDRAGPAGGRVHPAADRQRVADGLAGVDVQAASSRVGSLRDAEQQFGAGHRVDVGGDRHRQAERLGEHRADRGVRPAQPRVVEVAGGAVDHATGGDADPQRAAPVPAAQIAARAGGQRRPAPRPAGRAVSGSRPRRACGRAGRWPRCWWCGRRCGRPASGTARG